MYAGASVLAVPTYTATPYFTFLYAYGLYTGQAWCHCRIFKLCLNLTCCLMHLDPVFPWCLVQRGKCGSYVFGVRWLLLSWGEGIGDSKWDYLKSPREGDRAGSHCLVCFLLSEVNRSEGITSLWSLVMKSSWKQLWLLREHLAVKQTAVFPSPWGDCKKPSKWPLQEKFALASPFPPITHTLPMLLLSALCHHSQLPAWCFSSVKAFLGKAAHRDGGSLQQLVCFVIIPHVDTSCAC